jgi:diguanylate cyclase (GGDEF)-like protein
LFLIDADSGEIRPLNAAAARWLPPHQNGAQHCNVAQLLPELKLSKLPECITGFHLCRAIDPHTEIRPEVILHIYPLQPVVTSAHAPEKNDRPGLFGNNRHLMLLGLRPVNNASDPNATIHDAVHDAFHDALTRLPNRRLFHRRLERIIDRASRANYLFAVLFVDLDRFKSVNDRFGHTLGDKLLISASHRLLEAVRPQDMVARRDGDEFTILLDDLNQPQDALGVAQRIIDYLQLPLVVDEGEREATTVEIGASIGIAIGVDGALTAEELIAKADAAMYHAKALGGGVFLHRDELARDLDSLPTRTKPLPR